MRSVNIKGKHNIDKIKESQDETYQAVRKHMTNFEENELGFDKQWDMIREMYIKDSLNDDKSLLKSELIGKIQSYKSQDIKKELYKADTLITFDEVVEKLVGSKLRCAYCSQTLLLLYKNVREPTQWTLDRLDNDQGHTKENTCIACLKCNLQRRIMTTDKFTFTKKLKINKV